MSILDRTAKNFGLKVLALFLAVVLWLFVNFEKESEIEVSAPVEFKNLSAGLAVAGPVPSRLDIRIAGPKILLLRVRPDRLKVPLDLTGIKEGTAAFSGIEKLLPAYPGVRVTRVYPSTITVRLVRK